MLRQFLVIVMAVGLASCGPHTPPADHSGHGGAKTESAQTESAKPGEVSSALALTPAQAGTAHIAALNQTISIALPIKLAEKQGWVAAATLADLGPFMFHGLEEQPGAGPNGDDLIVFTYMAHEAGEGVLKFARAPAGVPVIGAGAQPDAAFESVAFTLTAK